MINPKSSLIIGFCLLAGSLKLSAQNIFPQKVEGCITSRFCLDCGDPKANYDSAAFAEIPKKISNTYNIANARGMIMFQVLVDSVGNGCVLSHTDASNNRITLDIIKYLNACKWTPAVENKKTLKSSINVRFTFADGAIKAGIERIDNVAMNENMKNPGTPTIYNKVYKYKNQSLNSYNISVWQKENSALPQDMSQHLVIDKNNAVWYATLNGFARFDGKDFVRLDKNNSPFSATEDLYALGIDKDSNIWTSSKEGTCKFDNVHWEKLDSAKVGVHTVYHITCADNGEILFCDDKGLVIYKNGNYKLINTGTVKEMPSNRVYHAYKDKQGRLWIGTFSGSIMIDKDGKVTSFNATDTPVKGTCLTGAVEDEQGNLYFSLYDYKASPERDRTTEGFVKLSADGKWTHYNDANSGLPANHINSLFYDKFEKVLWIGTNEAGLVRFDLKDGWENYNNKNSKVPSTYIYGIAQNSKGELYVSTYNGMMRISKR